MLSNQQQYKTMQAIISKYLPATNSKPSRIKATCERGSLVISFNSAEDAVQGGRHSFPWKSAEENPFIVAAILLCERFAKEDAVKYGSEQSNNPWLRPFVTGALPRNCSVGKYAHVFTSTP